jgi:hypothetical protein
MFQHLHAYHSVHTIVTEVAKLAVTKANADNAGPDPSVGQAHPHRVDLGAVHFLKPAVAHEGQKIAVVGADVKDAVSHDLLSDDMEPQTIKNPDGALGITQRLVISVGIAKALRNLAGPGDCREICMYMA